MDPWREILRKEHEGADGSFVMQLHGEARWDEPAHTRLFAAMRECCKAHEGQDTVERWIAEVFWYLSWWPRLLVERHWPGSEYHQDAVINFDHLAWWLFARQARDDGEFEPLE